MFKNESLSLSYKNQFEDELVCVLILNWVGVDGNIPN